MGECYEALGVYRGAVEYLQKALQQCEAGEVTLTSAVRLCRAVSGCRYLALALYLML